MDRLSRVGSCRKGENFLVEAIHYKIRVNHGYYVKYRYMGI